jgi:hypothetical protein
MGRAIGFIGLLIAVAIGGYIYTRQAKSALPEGASSPKSAIDLTAVKNDLLAIAQAERRYQATQSRYGSLSELRENGDTNVSDSRGPYSYSVETSDAGFVAKATYSGPDPAMPKVLVVDQTMQIRTGE